MVGYAVFERIQRKAMFSGLSEEKCRGQAGNAPDSGEVEFSGLLVNTSVNF